MYAANLNVEPKKSEKINRKKQSHQQAATTDCLVRCASRARLISWKRTREKYT